MDLDDIVFSGFANTELFEQMYDLYKKNPENVSASWRQFFSQIDSKPQTKKTKKAASIPSSQNDLRIIRLIEAYRKYGHLAAQINPISMSASQEPEELKLESLGFTLQDLNQIFPTCGLMNQEKATLKEIIDKLKSIYCQKIGFEYYGIVPKEIEKWLQDEIESGRYHAPMSIEQKQLILQHLNKSELFESSCIRNMSDRKDFHWRGVKR